MILVVVYRYIMKHRFLNGYSNLMSIVDRNEKEIQMKVYIQNMFLIMCHNAAFEKLSTTI